MGLGSGLLVKMGVDRVLIKAGYKEGSWISEVLDTSTSRQTGIDIYVTTSEFAHNLMDLPSKVVVVKDMFNEEQIRVGLLDVYKEVLKNQKE
jgi:galactitol-specific phosphotransferase system IIB component